MHDLMVRIGVESTHTLSHVQQKLNAQFPRQNVGSVFELIIKAAMDRELQDETKPHAWVVSGAEDLHDVLMRVDLRLDQELGREFFCSNGLDVVVETFECNRALAAYRSWKKLFSIFIILCVIICFVRNR